MKELTLNLRRVAKLNPAISKLLNDAADEIDCNEKKLSVIDNEILELIDERDLFNEKADMLSDEISRFFCVDVGEHTSANCPWDNAFECIPEGNIIKLKQKTLIDAKTFLLRNGFTYGAPYKLDELINEMDIDGKHEDKK